MAIDAKDWSPTVIFGTTHATSLARQVGVRDEKVTKAIEAAALLHDMGKLVYWSTEQAGKLTEAEFKDANLRAWARQIS